MKITLIALAFSLSCFNAKSAIVYTDIVDVTLASGGTIDINFDGAGAAEFTLQDLGFGGTVEPGIYFDANAHFVTEAAFPTNGWDFISGLALNTVISSQSGWYDQGDGYIDPVFAQNPYFSTGGDVYIGAKVNLSSAPTDTVYGWIQVNWDGAGTLVVKGFAYESTPNAPINAGDMGGTTSIKTGVEEVQVSIYPNPAIDYIVVNNVNPSQIISLVEVYGVGGKRILTHNFVRNNEKIDVTNLKRGVYYIKIIANGKKSLIHNFIKR